MKEKEEYVKATLGVKVLSFYKGVHQSLSNTR